MWPMLLDMSRDECKKVLRRLELEAYSSLLSSFRAQGDLNKEKKRILQDLQQALSISTERHRAEVRRAINDEKLSTIADQMAGPNTEAEWLIEGRRLIPLMPRLVPQTAFTVTANHVANVQAEKNASMPSPSQTGNKEPNVVSSPPTPVGTKMSRPASPNSNVVVLPSGMSIHIKGGLNTEDEDESTIGRKRRRSQSTETIMSPSAGTQTPRVTYTTTAASSIGGMSPMKITISKSPQGRSQVSSNISQSQKVILVSSSGQSSSPSILQKSITVPVVKSAGSYGSVSGQNKASIILPNSGVTSSNGGLGNIVTMTSSTMSAATSTCTSTVGTTSTMTFLTPAVSVPKPRIKTTIPRQRFTQVSQGQQKPGVVIPMGPQPVHPNPQSVQNIHIKPISKSGSAIQIRQEGGMKIITQSMSGASSSKILPKPTMTSSSGTPVVVVSAGSTTPSSSSVTVSRASQSLGHTGTKILNITQGGKVISGLNRTANVVTVNPKTLHLTAVKSGAGGTGKLFSTGSGKPNVIVVQKTNPRRSPSLPGSKGSTVISSPYEKELLSFLHKQDTTKHIVVTTPGGQRTVERKVIVTTPGQLEAASRQRGRSDAEGKTSLLADLIHAAGIVPDSGGESTEDVTINLDEDALAALTVSSQNAEATAAQSKPASATALPNNEWFEYDVADDSQQYQTSENATGAPSKPKVMVQRSASVDLSQLSDQLSQQQFYTIEQAMRILNQPDRADGGATTADAVSLLRMEAQNLLEQNAGGGRSPSSLVVDPDASASTTSSSQESNEGPQTELEQIAHSLGFQGELDPQTGIFYSMAANAGQGEAVVVTAANPQVGDGTAVSKPFDLLSSSLAQAQIDLDPYQFIEEGVLVGKPAAEAVSTTTVQTTPRSHIHQDEIIEVPSTSVIEEETTLEDDQDHIKEQTEPSTMRVKSSSFIPIQDISKAGQTGTINITRHSQALQGGEIILAQEDIESTEDVQVITLQHQPQTSLQEVTLTMDPNSELSELSNLSESMSSAVTVETAQMVDPVDVRTDLSNLEDMGVVSSPSAGTGNSSDSQGDSMSGADLMASLRMSKRKRKPPTNIEDSPTQTIVSSTAWNRSCLLLISRVSRYRGLNREKGDLNAASWFTEPVDPAEVPDYYAIIKSPMDFGTIKRKIENTVYNDHEEFHSDMLLVRDNCRLYNPPGSTVRRDCDEVFAFYMSEYEKLLEKWQKAHISSPSIKKLKFENKSPVRL